jgi:glycosyltransferase involved in cell wall biosynthesis
MNKLISIVMPVFNEDKGLNNFYNRLKNVVNKLPYDFELIFVNDGSIDNSLEVIISLRENDKRIKIMDLSRNFGHQNALTAGIDEAKGDAVILLDADLEDNPEYINSFIEFWNKGYQVVYARRGERQVSGLRKICFDLFHKTNRVICSVNMDAAGAFCLMDRNVVMHIQKLTETDKYIPGLRSWIGFKQIGINTVREARYDNEPRVKFISLLKLAFDSFTSFSTVPLRISMFLGIIFSLLSFIGIIIVIALKLIFKLAIVGWASTISIILLLGGIQLVCIGLQGEYIARIFSEVKKRPNYIIRDKMGFDE